MLRPEEAWARLAGRIPAPASERVARRQALGRRLASPLAATADVPAADVSAMDARGGGECRPAPRCDKPTIAAGEAPGVPCRQARRCGS
jgi:hypothetical protein